MIGPQSPGFAAAVAQIVGKDQPDGLVAWLPYGVVIKNNSSEDLAAIAVEWRGSFNGGPFAHGGGVLPAWFNAPGRQVKPGQSIVALPQATLASPRDLRQFANGRGMGNLQTFQKADRLEVTLDGVVFASGQFAGTDDLHEYEEWQAQLDAPRKLAAAVLEKQNSAPIADTVTWLTSVAAVRGGSDPNARHTAGMARLMLNVYSSKGEAALYSMAQEILQPAAFPLHR